MVFFYFLIETPRKLRVCVRYRKTRQVSLVREHAITPRARTLSRARNR